MKDLQAPYRALSAVIEEKKRAKEAILSAVKEEHLNRPDEDYTAKLVLFALRHYRTLTFETLNLLSYSPKSASFYLSLLAVASLRYLHTDVESLYEASFKRRSLLGDPKASYAVLKKASQLPFEIPSEVKTSPFYYPSLVYETPEFLLRRWSKDFGREVAFAMANALRKKEINFYIPTESGKNPLNLKEHVLANGATLYSSDHLLNEEERKDYLPSNVFEAYLAHQIQVPQLSPKLFFLSPKNPILPLYFDSIGKDLYECEIDAAVEEEKMYRALMDGKFRFSLTESTIYLTALKLAKTLFKYGIYDFVFLEGDDIGLGEARRRPGLLPSLEEKDFALSFERQLTALREAAPFVKEGGKLLFYNHALDFEETRKVAKEFLVTEKSFALEKEEFLLPQHSQGDSGYYALFSKEVRK